MGGHGMKKYLLIIIVLLIAVVGMGKVLTGGIGTSASPEEFIDLFEDGQYEACAELADGKSPDSEFAAAVEDTVESELQDVFDSYFTGEIKYKEASEKLKGIRKAAGSMFGDRIDAVTEKTDGVHDMYRALWSVDELMTADKFKEGYESLMKAMELSQTLDVDIDWAVCKVMKQDIDGIKYYLFSEYENAVVNGEAGYKYIEETGAMVVKYTDDQDFSNFLSSVTALRSGQYSEQMGIAITKTIAANAKVAWADAHVQ